MIARRHRSLLSVVILLTVASAASARADVIQEQIALVVGQQRTVDARKVKSYSVADREHIEVRLTPDGTEFVIVARKPGTTSLLLIRTNGDKVHYTIRIAAASK